MKNHNTQNNTLPQGGKRTQGDSLIRRIDRRLLQVCGRRELPKVFKEVTNSMGIMLKEFALEEVQNAGVNNVKQLIDYLFSKVQHSYIPLVASRIITEFGYDPRTQQTV